MYSCPWSTHWQTGGCVTLSAPRVKYTDDSHINLRFQCPSMYPYVFEGAFSGNPVWTDNSNGMGAIVRAVMNTGGKDPQQSYVGFDAMDVGHVTVESRSLAGSYWQNYTAGEYVCTNSYPQPL